jgi:hypothetical protein
MLREHLINIIEVMIEKKISEVIQRMGPEHKVFLVEHFILDVGEAYDKPHRRRERERIVENWHKFPSDIMAWHGGGQSAKNEFL